MSEGRLAAAKALLTASMWSRGYAGDVDRNPDCMMDRLQWICQDKKNAELWKHQPSTVQDDEPIDTHVVVRKKALICLMTGGDKPSESS